MIIMMIMMMAMTVMLIMSTTMMMMMMMMMKEIPNGVELVTFLWTRKQFGKNQGTVHALERTSWTFRLHYYQERMLMMMSKVTGVTSLNEKVVGLRLVERRRGTVKCVLADGGTRTADLWIKQASNLKIPPHSLLFSKERLEWMIFHDAIRKRGSVGLQMINC